MPTQCLKCGSKVVYEGLTTQECVSPDCENFCGKEEETQESEGYVTWGDLNFDALAGGFSGLIWP